MDEADRKLLQKIFSLPQDKQQKLCDSMGELMAKLKADSDAKPENAGKPKSHVELWDEFAGKPKNGKDSG